MIIARINYLQFSVGSTLYLLLYYLIDRVYLRAISYSKICKHLVFGVKPIHYRIQASHRHQGSSFSGLCGWMHFFRVWIKVGEYRRRYWSSARWWCQQWFWGERVRHSVFPLIWKLYVDGSSIIDASGVGIILVSLEGFTIRQTISFKFKATNNETEYEALLVGLKLARCLEVSNLLIFSDS